MIWTLISAKVTRAIAWAMQSAAHIFAIGMVFALLWGWIGHHNAAKYKRVLASTEQAYRNAQEDAKAAQIAANFAAEARYRSKADETDSDYRKALDGANTRAERFIAAGGVRACATGQASQSDPAAQGDGAQGADGAGQPAILVAVKPEDVNICTENTMRLRAAREWALGLAD